jgi:hypothetical protein
MRQKRKHPDVDEKGTLKATKHDTYDNIVTRFDWACSCAVMEMHITAHAA